MVSTQKNSSDGAVQRKATDVQPTALLKNVFVTAFFLGYSTYCLNIHSLKYL